MRMNMMKNISKRFWIQNEKDLDFRNSKKILRLQIANMIKLCFYKQIRIIYSKEHFYQYFVNYLIFKQQFRNQVMERNIALRSSLLLNHTSLRTTQNSNKYNQNSRVFHSNTSIQKRIVQPNIQNQKQVYSEKPTKKQKKDEIYNKVLYFINSLIDNPVMLSNLIKSLNFSQKNQKNLLSTTKMKDNQIFSTTNFCSNLSLDKRIENPKKKKISIQSFQSLLSSDTIQSLTSLSIEITFESDFRLNVKLLKEIFDEPSPFLIIESLCLLCKFLWKTKIILKNENCVKILIPCVILSYKILYDQQLTGMQEHFANLISSEQIQISGLEAKFLKQIEFEVEIENHQYYLVSQNVLLRGNR